MAQKPVRPVRGDANLGINQKAALWKDFVNAAKGGTKEEPVDATTMNNARRIVADRLWPKLKPESKKLNLNVSEDSTMEEKLNILLYAAMTGGADVGAVTELISAIGSTYAIRANSEILEQFEQLKDQLVKWQSENARNQKVSLRRGGSVNAEESTDSE